MRLVVAIGGNALLARGEIPSASLQRSHVAIAARSLGPLARDHQLVITHGNGPQVGLLATESQLDPVLAVPYPLDIIGAQTQGMIGYLLLQALSNVMGDRMVVNLVTQTEVAASDPAFELPTKPIGRILTKQEASQLAASLDWTVRPDGQAWRRVVPSPRPLRVIELESIRNLLEVGAVVVCAGGGGIPVLIDANGTTSGAEAVIDKDETAAMLARELGADALVILTDVENVQLEFGLPGARAIGRTTPSALRSVSFASGSMGPKVDAACRFVELTGKPAMIGALGDVQGLLDRSCGTIIEPDPRHVPLPHPISPSAEEAPL